MILNVSQSSSVIFFILFLMPLILAHKSYFYGRGHYAFLNRSNVEALKGASMVLILIQSAVHQLPRADLFLRAIASLGDIALAVFLFYSGYEVVRLGLKSRQKIRRMMIKKMMGLLLVLLSGNLLFGVVLIYLGEHIHLSQILIATLKFHLIDGTGVLLLAPLFYFYFIILMSCDLKFLLVASLSFSGFCYLTGWSPMVIFYLLGGAILATYPRYVFLILKRQLLNLTLVLGILIMVFFILKSSYLMPWIGIIGTLIMLMKVQFKSPVFALMDRLAIPLYTVYLAILYFVFYSSEPRHSFWILFSLGISLIVALGLKSLKVIFYNRLQMW